MSEDLKPCPFCGGEPTVRTRQGESLWSHNIVTKTVISCGECDILFETEPGYELEAPEAWNRRAPLSSQTPAESDKSRDEPNPVLSEETVGLGEEGIARIIEPELWCWLDEGKRPITTQRIQDSLAKARLILSALPVGGGAKTDG